MPCLAGPASEAAAPGPARPDLQDTSCQAVGTLSALLALVLERGSPLHGALLGFAAQHGAALLEGLLLALISLNSGSHLPKARRRAAQGPRQLWAKAHFGSRACPGRSLPRAGGTGSHRPLKARPPGGAAPPPFRRW